MKHLFCILALLISNVSLADDNFAPGVHYQTLNTSASSSAKVVEYFSYYCPFCYNFEPIVAELKQALPADVPLHKIPVSFHGGALAPDVQRAHALAETLNVSGAFSATLFEQIHQQRKPPQNVAALKQLFTSLGVDPGQFDANFNSLPINAMVAQYNHAIDNANIRSVPSFIINDKYLVVINAVSSQQQFNALVNYLLTLKNEEVAP